MKITMSKRRTVKNYLGIKYARFQISRHGFWFVDIPRTSSSSIRAELGKKFGRAYGKKNVIGKEFVTKQIFADHLTAKEMSTLLGKSIWENIFTFTIVRNPWERTYSIYNYRRKVCDIPEEWSFRDYVHALRDCSPGSEFFKNHAYRFGAADYVLGESDEILVDYIVKYENRKDELKFVASRLNFNKLGDLHIQDASPGNNHYSNAYDTETIEIIRNIYTKDIQLFDYRFDDKS